MKIIRCKKRNTARDKMIIQLKQDKKDCRKEIKNNLIKIIDNTDNNYE